MPPQPQPSNNPQEIQRGDRSPLSAQQTPEAFTARFAIRLVEQGFGLTDQEIFKRVRDSSFDQFQSFLVRLNGLVTDTPIAKRAIVQRENEVNRDGCSTQGYVAPDGAHKDVLLRHLHEACKKIEVASELGMMLFLGTQLIHPFPDGNGRTGRFLLSVLSSPEHERQDFIRNRVAAWIAHDDQDFGPGQKMASDVLRPSCECFALVANFLCEDSYGSLGYPGVKRISGGAAEMPGWLGGINNGNLNPDQLDVMRRHVLADHADFTTGNNKSYVDLAFLRLAKEFPNLQSHIGPIENGTLSIRLLSALENLNRDEGDRFIHLVRNAHAEVISTLIDSISQPERFPTNDGRPFKHCYRS